MTFINLIGLISAVSLILYFILYFIKPNYQQKYVSSTYIWKLSLKYKKKRINMNKFRNLLLILTQILLLTVLTLIIMRPVVITKELDDNESIVIIDASCSMRTIDDNEVTRFERAINLAENKIKDVCSSDGTISVVISTNKPYFLAERESKESLERILLDLDLMKENISCTYGTTDLNKAIELCNEILNENTSTGIFIYTDVTVDYLDRGITVVNVRNAIENNVAILNAYTEFIDNYYSFVVELVSYGRDQDIELTLDVYGANPTEELPMGDDIHFIKDVELVNDQIKKIVFANESLESDLIENENVEYFFISDEDRIFGYDSIHVSTGVEDSFYYDNSFDIYGGQKEVIKVLYASSEANSFFTGILYVLEAALADSYDIQITVIKDAKQLVNNGFDLYIYEHAMMPTVAPNDGVVIYADPQANVTNSGFSVSGVYKDFNKVSLPFTEVNTHPIINGLDSSNMTVSRVLVASNIDKGYETIYECDNGRPVMLVKDDETTKNIVLLFSLHYSNLPIIKEFPLLMINIFNHFFPKTVNSNSFAVDDSVNVNSRGKEVFINYNDNIMELNTFPTSIYFDIPGSYQIYQTTIFGKDIEDMIYVRISQDESNILMNIDSLNNPAANMTLSDIYDDLLLWFSIALVALMFFEWILKGKDTL